MDRRRLTWIIALIVIIVVIAVLAYFNNRQDVTDDVTVVAPSPSRDESAPAPDPVVEAPPRVVILDQTPPEEPAPTGSEEPAPTADTVAETAAGDLPAPAGEVAVGVEGAPELEAVAEAGEPQVATIDDQADDQGPGGEAADIISADQVEDVPAVDAVTNEPPPTDEIVVTEAPAATAPEVAPPADEIVVTEAPAPEVTPPADEIVVTEVPVEATPEAGPAAEDIVIAEAPAAVDEAEIPAIIPSFDLVRVEPSGDTVVAGRAAPESTVDVLDGTAVIATARANDRGEWALVLDVPLPPGSHDLAIRTTLPSGDGVLLSDQRVAVFVPEPGEKDVLVVLAEPEAASELLQVPEGVADTGTADAAPAEAAVADTEVDADKANTVAAVEPAGTSKEEGTVVAVTPDTGSAVKADEAAPLVVEADAADADTVVADAGAPAARDEESTEVALAPTPDTMSDTKDDATVEAASEGPAADTEIVVATSQTAPEPVSEPEPVSPAPSAEAAAPQPAAEPVSRPPPPAPPPEPVIQPQVVVTAVEADSAGALYVAGTAGTGEPVRVYIGNDLIGQARPSPSGTWLVEVQREMPSGTYDVRADQVDSSGGVLARAEVPFRREIDVAILEPVSESGSGSGSGSGTQLTGDLPELRTVIIKRGDNLWRISRRTYGRGVRYSTIYQANRDQISNPRWIFPGQVFVLPQGNVDWEQ